MGTIFGRGGVTKYIMWCKEKDLRLFLFMALVPLHFTGGLFLCDDILHLRVVCIHLFRCYLGDVFDNDRIRSYSVCSMMIAYYHQVKTPMSFFLV
jgi:hypothetical protein